MHAKCGMLQAQHAGLPGDPQRQALVRCGERAGGGAPVGAVGVDAGAGVHRVQDPVAKKPRAGELGAAAARAAAARLLQLPPDGALCHGGALQSSVMPGLGMPR